MLQSTPPIARAPLPLRARLLPYAIGTGVVAIASVVAFGLEKVLPLPNLSLVFLLGVLFLGMKYGAVPALGAGLLSCAVYNFLFTPPYFTFVVDHEDDTLTLAFFLVVAGLTGHFAGSVQRRLTVVSKTAERTALLYDFSRKVAAASDIPQMIAAVRDHADAALSASAEILLPRPEEPDQIDLSGLTADDETAARFAWERSVPAGRCACGAPDAQRLFMPLVTAHGRVGLLALEYRDGRRALTSEQEDLLRTVVDQAAVAIERAQLSAEAERSRWLSETETLRAALLSSISHDLRTPLVSVIGSATTLSSVGPVLSGAERAELVATILSEAKRLNRFVQNLLDMTRLSYGGLHLRRDWVDPHDIVGHAVAAMKEILAPFRVELRIAPDLPLIFADPVLIEQAIINVLDNAAKFSPFGEPIVVDAYVKDDTIEIAVSDRGPGIPEAERQRVFDMFVRVRERDARRAGTGLGLAICRGFLAAHNGGVVIGDNPEAGARVVMWLPLVEPPPGDAEGERG